MSEKRIEWTNEKRRLSELIPWERNPRQINKDQAKRLAQSFDEFGQVETIAIGPGAEVYNGHQRLNVLLDKHGGDYEVEVRVASRALTEKEREKLTIYLHKGAAGEFDFDILANEFELDDLLDWGFEPKELDLDLWAKDEPPEDPGAQIDKAEELREKWGVESGQLWQLGEHRLICGDCTDRAVVERVMQGEKADCTVTDPPYGVNVNYESFEDTPDKVRELIKSVMPIIFEHLPAAFTPGVPAMWDYPRPAWVGAWVHPAPVGGCPWGFVGNNPILYYGADPYLKIGRGRRPDSVVMASDRQGEANHPTPKPIKVWEWLVERLTPEIGAIVFDPFSGSGTTLIACERLGRKCRAIEISAAYVAVAIERWVTMTGGTPVLLDN